MNGTPAYIINLIYGLYRRLSACGIELLSKLRFLSVSLVLVDKTLGSSLVYLLNSNLNCFCLLSAVSDLNVLEECLEVRLSCLVGSSLGLVDLYSSLRI